MTRLEIWASKYTRHKVSKCYGGNLVSSRHMNLFQLFKGDYIFQAKVRRDFTQNKRPYHNSAVSQPKRVPFPRGREGVKNRFVSLETGPLYRSVHLLLRRNIWGIIHKWCRLAGREWGWLRTRSWQESGGWVDSTGAGNITSHGLR